MASELAEAIRLLVQDRGVSEELIKTTIEQFLLAAYKKRFGTEENAVVRFSDEGDDVTIFAKKQIVEEVEDPVFEISLENAKDFYEDSEIGDELLIEINPHEFDRGAVQSAKQKAKQTLREIQKDTLYSEFKDKIGEMIIGYYQRERNGNIFVDLGKTEGILPKRYQSPREIYRQNDRIKALIYDVEKNPNGLQIVLSRTHSEFVKRVFELEVPEIYDKTVEIYKIVREAGYRTKIAVYSNREDVDPVGACVGLKGVRIQAIVRELEGEKIDILKYDTDPRVFIKNALSPAEVLNVIILDEGKRQALAVVPENQLSLAIGKQGLNVRLANRLADWNIDMKTEEQFAEMDIAGESKRAVSALFGDTEDQEEEITDIGELPGITEDQVDKLKSHGIELIEQLVSLSDEELESIAGLSDDDIANIKKIVEESVEIIEDEQIDETEDEGTTEAATAGGIDEKESEESPQQVVDEERQDAYDSVEESEEEESYECPECGHPVTVDMTVCPNCGVGLSFEIEEAEEESEEE
ncbi:MAG: transcription termination factor NusA [Spirochaetales bacterium]|nr:transcription termination factor NusA [Spirochaetales bacterium]MCF7938841.1 transcription termination factor NusA [Spirochaetales bacterium]